jgi:hypothetical protein
VVANNTIIQSQDSNFIPFSITQLRYGHLRIF